MCSLTSGPKFFNTNSLCSAAITNCSFVAMCRNNLHTCQTIQYLKSAYNDKKLQKKFSLRFHVTSHLQHKIFSEKAKCKTITHYQLCCNIIKVQTSSSCCMCSSNLTVISATLCWSPLPPAAFKCFRISWSSLALNSSEAWSIAVSCSCKI